MKALYSFVLPVVVSLSMVMSGLSLVVMFRMAARIEAIRQDPHPSRLGLRAAFQGVDAERDRELASETCAALAKVVEADGGKKLDRREQFAALVAGVGELATGGEFSRKYPDFAPTLAKLGKDRVPLSEGKATDEDRAKLVALLREIADELR